MKIKWFGHLGTLASLVGIILLLNGMEKPPLFLMGVLISLSVIMFILSIIFEIKTIKKPGLYCENEKEINDYMINWIQKGGRVIVFTRDMSWAQHDITVKDMLLRKSKNNELSIILAEKSEFISELEENGANIYTYGELNYTPTSRFTIVKRGRIDSKVAIGTEKDGKHYIEEFSQNDGYQFPIANDLANILIHYNNLMRGLKNGQTSTSTLQERE